MNTSGLAKAKLVRAMSASMRDGVRTARVTDPHSVWCSPGVHRMRKVGCVSAPV